MFDFNEQLSENLASCCFFSWNSNSNNNVVSKKQPFKHTSQTKHKNPNLKAAKQFINGMPMKVDKPCFSLKKVNRDSHKHIDSKMSQIKSPTLKNQNSNLKSLIEHHHLQNDNTKSYRFIYSKPPSHVYQTRKQKEQQSTKTTLDIISNKCICLGIQNDQKQKIDFTPLHVNFVSRIDSKQTLTVTSDRTTAQPRNRGTVTTLHKICQNRASHKSKIEYTKNQFSKIHKKYNLEHYPKSSYIKDQKKNNDNIYQQLESITLLQQKQKKQLECTSDQKIEEVGSGSGPLDTSNILTSWEHIHVDNDRNNSQPLKILPPLKKLLSSESNAIPTVTSICQSNHQQPKIQQSQIMINFFNPSHLQLRRQQEQLMGNSYFAKYLQNLQHDKKK